MLLMTVGVDQCRAVAVGEVDDNIYFMTGTVIVNELD